MQTERNPSYLQITLAALDDKINEYPRLALNLDDNLQGIVAHVGKFRVIVVHRSIRQICR